MDRWIGRVALVTGASAGIGAALVRALVKQGMKVVGCARHVERIEALANELKGEKGSVKPIKCDVTKEEEILAMFSSIKSDPGFGGVDVCINGILSKRRTAKRRIPISRNEKFIVRLVTPIQLSNGLVHSDSNRINNAGLAHSEPLLSGNSDKWRNMLDVNVLGVCMVTREAYKSMQERKVDDGHIFILNSMSGHRVINASSVHFYSATKFAVTALIEGYRNELREAKSGIRITSVSPGVVETEFSYRMNPDNPDKAKAMYSSLECLQDVDIANTVVFALQSPAHMQIHDILLRPTHQKS